MDKKYGKNRTSENRISSAFSHGKAIIPFITCGDPSIDITEQLVLRMADAGADLIELGIPFSDPTAEGPVIQAAEIRAVSRGVTTDKIFAMVERIRTRTEIPLLFMTYANSIFSYDATRFMERASNVHIDGIILPDLPFEERGEFSQPCRAHDITQISMIAPTSRERIEKIATQAEGFVYCVSSPGCTGIRREFSTDIAKMVTLVKEVKSIPCVIGFGIHTPEQAANMAKHSDGMVVGSTIVQICEKYGNACIPKVVEYIKTMKNALRNVDLYSFV